MVRRGPWRSGPEGTAELSRLQGPRADWNRHCSRGSRRRRRQRATASQTVPMTSRPTTRATNMQGSSCAPAVTAALMLPGRQRRRLDLDARDRVDIVQLMFLWRRSDGRLRGRKVISISQTSQTSQIYANFDSIKIQVDLNSHVSI